MLFRSQDILFFADTDEEKARWSVLELNYIAFQLNSILRLEVFRALVGHIPPHPLWAEMLWQRQEEIAKRMQAAQPLPPHASRH